MLSEFSPLEPDAGGGGQDIVELQPYHGNFQLYSLEQAGGSPAAGHILLRYNWRQRGKDYLERNRCGTLCRNGAILSQLVAAGPPPASRGGHGFVCLHPGCRLSLPAEGGIVDEPPVPAPADGGPLQHRERELHAGNPADDERVFRQPAYTFPLQGQDARRVDQRGQSFPGLHRTGYAGIGQVLCGGQQLYPPDDFQGLQLLPVRLQVRRPLNHCLQHVAAQHG